MKTVAHHNSGERPSLCIGYEAEFDPLLPGAGGAATPDITP